MAIIRSTNVAGISIPDSVMAMERDELIENLVSTIYAATPEIHQKMVELFTRCEPDYGKRVGYGLKIGK